MPARKRKTIVEETLPESDRVQTGDEVTDFDVTLESVEDAETLQKVLDQFGATADTHLKVFKQNAKGWQFCFRRDDTTIDEEFIRSNFGGGDFIIRVFIRGIMRHQIPLAIAEMVGQENSNGNGNGRNGDSHTQFLEKLLMTILARESTTAAPASPTLTDLTAALSNLDNLRAKPESQMDTFMKGIQFAMDTDKGRASGDWKSDLITTAKEALPVIGNMFMSAKMGTPPTQVQPGAQPAQVVSPEQANAKEALMIKQAIDYLKKQCIKGVEPGLIIDWIVNNAEEYQGLIHMVLNTPFDTFVQYDNQVNSEPFKQWFSGLFDGLRLAFTADDSLDVDTTGHSGNPGDTGNDGDIRENAKRKSK